MMSIVPNHIKTIYIVPKFYAYVRNRIVEIKQKLISLFRFMNHFIRKNVNLKMKVTMNISYASRPFFTCKVVFLLCLEFFHLFFCYFLGLAGGWLLGRGWELTEIDPSPLLPFSILFLLRVGQNLTFLLAKFLY